MDAGEPSVCEQKLTRNVREKIAERISRQPAKQTPYEHLSREQLLSVLSEYHKDINALKLSNLNLSRRSTTLEENSRQHMQFMQTLSQYHVPRMSKLIATEIRAGRSLESIAVRIRDAAVTFRDVPCAAAPKRKPLGYEQWDLDMARYILALPQGAKLLRLLSKLGMTMGPDTAKRGAKQIYSPLIVKEYTREVILKSLDSASVESARQALGLSFDFVYIERLAQWWAQTNEMAGFCIEHNYDHIVMSVNSEEELRKTKNYLDAGLVHLVCL